MKFSVRTILAFTFSVAAIFSMLRDPSYAFVEYLLIPAYIACWIVPAASVGYDYDPTYDGIMRGILVGGILCFLSFLISVTFLPAVQ